jgi:hypothetical protein
MTNDRETLPDLIETRSAEHTIPRRKLWRLAFAAILDGALNPDFGELTLDTAFDHGGTKLTWRRVIADGLAGLGRRADPARWNWSATLSFSPVAFDRWLREALRTARFSAHPKRRPGAKGSKRNAVCKFLDERRFPDSTPYKEIAREVKDALGFDVSDRTIARARGRR